MKKLITFLGGLVLIALIIAMLFLTSAIYDSAKTSSISTYFFQRNLRSVERTGAPETPSQIGETAMREMLIKKYVNEYFYAIPDVEDIAKRTMRSSTLASMSTTEVFKNWAATTAEEIQKLAEEKKMRMVEIDGEIFKPADSDYWVVPYALYTWDTPNDMNAVPTITHGTLLMDVFYAPGTRETIDVGHFLKHSYNRFESGYDPAIIFRFGVMNVENITND